jgi:hypothetical protein
VPFVRFARDKRGYEYVFLVEAASRGRSGPPRLLYWYRTPPGLKVGREPFDAEVRRALEERYRDIHFDWASITAAQPPSAEGEMWRERRKAKREARAAQTPRAPQPASPSAAGEPPAEDALDADADMAALQDEPDVEPVAAEDEAGADILESAETAERADRDGDSE